jgi:hypothetical protein
VSEQKDDTMADDARTRAAEDGPVEGQGAATDKAVDPGVEPRPDAGSGDGEPDRAVDPAGAAADRVSGTQLRLRRAPRYGAFGLTGMIFGVVAGVVLALSFTAASNYSMQTIAGYFAAIFGLVGALSGLGVAVLIERRRS